MSWSSDAPGRRLAPAIAVAAACHAAFFTLVGIQVPAAAQGSGAVQLKLSLVAAPPAAVPGSPRAQGAVREAAPVPQRPGPEAAPRPSEPPLSESESEHGKTEPSPSIAESIAELPGASAQTFYLPRAWLTKAPAPVSNIDIPFPSMDGRVDVDLQATLLIDEFGVVRDVVVTPQRIHPHFLELVKDVFGRAKFAPGELDGTPVPSQIRVEIEFRG